MSPREAPTRTEALLAYALSALTTLLWVACVLPAGELPSQGPTGDAAVPLHRAALLLVPALLLLIATPVGCTLARRERGMRALLATTDAFVAFYVATALWVHGMLADPATALAALLLVVLGVLSLAETLRASRVRDGMLKPPVLLAGARFAICLLVLIVPLYVLLKPAAEHASLLAPFFFIAIGAGGARLARSMRGLHRTSALVQLLLAAHILITLRYTIYSSPPALTPVYPAGQVALGLSIVIVVCGLLQMAVYLRPRAHAVPAADPATAAPSA